MVLFVREYKKENKITRLRECKPYKGLRFQIKDYIKRVKKMIDVVAGILINKNNEILIAKRKEEKILGGYWEFPGGKIDDGETPEESLIRELMEEMNINIKINKYFGENIYDYERGTIRLIAYIGEISAGQITLTDHSEYQWIKKDEFIKYKMAPADVYFVKKLEGLV